MIDSTATFPQEDRVYAYGLTPSKQAEIEEKRETGQAFGYTTDVVLVRTDAGNPPPIHETINDVIEAGFIPPTKSK